MLVYVHRDHIKDYYGRREAQDGHLNVHAAPELWSWCCSPHSETRFTYPLTLPPVFRSASGSPKHRSNLSLLRPPPPPPPPLPFTVPSKAVVYFIVVASQRFFHHWSAFSQCTICPFVARKRILPLICAHFLYCLIKINVLFNRLYVLISF